MDHEARESSARYDACMTSWNWVRKPRDVLEQIPEALHERQLLPRYVEVSWSSRLLFLVGSDATRRG